MPSASAQLLVSVDGGAPASGGQTTANDAATIALSAVSKVGWGNPPTRWQIASFPSGFACPAGWSTATTTIGGQSVAVYQYTGNSDPPAFDLPGGGWWGKLLFRLVVLGGTTSTLVDELCGVSVESPNGVADIAFLEAGQFDAARRAVGPLQANLRLLEDALAAGGGGTVTDVTGTAPIVSSGGATPAISINAASGTGPGSMSTAHWTLCDGATSSPTASTLAKRDAAGRFQAVAGVAADDVAVVSQLSSGGGWQVGYSVDFGSLPGNNLLSGGDGTKLIGGKSWNLAGSAEAVSLDVVPGTGIVGAAACPDPPNGHYFGLWIPINTLASVAALADRDVCVLVHMKRTTIGSAATSQFLVAVSPLAGTGSLPSVSMYGALGTEASTDAIPVVAAYGYGGGVDRTYTGPAADEIVTAWQIPAGAASGSGFYDAVAAIPSSVADLKSCAAFTCPRAAPSPYGLWSRTDPHIYLRWYSAGGTSVWAICGLTVLYR